MGAEVDVRVLQVVPSYYPASVYGGPIFSIHHACQALARKGVKVNVATTNANGSFKLDVPTREAVKFEPNYHVHYYDDTINNRFSWAFTLNLWRDIRKADIVHLQDVFSAHAAWTLLLTTIFSKSVLISPRGVFTPWGLTGKRPWLKKAWLARLVRPFVGNIRRVAWHATSAVERGEIFSVFPGARVHVIPNAIDCSAFDEAPRVARTDYLTRFFPTCRIAPNDTWVLVAMGRLHPKKSFDTVIRAFPSVAKAHPGAVLLIAGGDDGERNLLSRLIIELSLQDRVALIGEVSGSDKIAFLKGADLFLFPSHTENFGMVALEAMAAGLPVVASRNTPWAEVESIGSGLWVDNTPEAFTTAIVDLLCGDLTAMRRKARDHAAQIEGEEGGPSCGSPGPRNGASSAPSSAGSPATSAASSMMPRRRARCRRGNGTSAGPWPCSRPGARSWRRSQPNPYTRRPANPRPHAIC